MKVIRSYKRISWASLNLSKSIAIPFYMRGPIPRWLLEVGCNVVKRREVIIYLDALLATRLLLLWRLISYLKSEKVLQPLG